MARAIERIERDIAALEEAAITLATDLHSTYAKYLAALGQAVRQQLILASYHLCTQGYPEAFLKLSFSQRQQLQQAINKLGQQAAEQLIAALETEEKEAEKQESVLVAEIPQIDDANWGSELSSSLPPHSEHESHVGVQAEKLNIEEQESFSLTEENLHQLLVGQELAASNASDSLLDDPNNSAEFQTVTNEPALHPEDSLSPTPFRPSQERPSKIEKLVQWQQNLEVAIVRVLKKTSRETNLVLHKAKILPKNLPEPLLEAATKVEASAEAISGPPNLLNLLIEIDNDVESEQATVTSIISIHLRLAEIEFADANARAGRNQIRSLEARVRSLGREYQKKQREKIIAEAESAWRVSWFEE